MSPSKVTIAIPTLNRARYLEIALSSALAQTYSNLEIVISDNASSDDTPALLDRFADPRIRRLRQPTLQSMVGNWNACVAAATGEYFLLLSDDDVLEPDAIASMVSAFEEAPNPERVGFVYCRGRVIDGEGNLVRQGQESPAEESGKSLVYQLLEGKRDTWPCSILLRRSDMQGGYSTDFLLITDAAMWLRAIAQHGVALFVDRMLVNYRVHQNLTATTPPAVWQKDSSDFVDFAIRTLTAANMMDTQSEFSIRKALRRLNVRLAVAMPLGTPNRTVSGVLSVYWSQRAILSSGYGLFLLAQRFIFIARAKLFYRRAQVAAAQGGKTEV